MRRCKHAVTREKELFFGIDLHKHRRHVTIRTFDVELLSASIPITGQLCSTCWHDLLGIRCRRSIKSDIWGLINCGMWQPASPWESR
jgi:hypothetical protein